jgi:hypothetical protein
MFTKILIANRGVRAAGGGVRSHLREAHVMRAPNRMARVACGGDFTSMGTIHV